MVIYYGRNYYSSQTHSLRKLAVSHVTTDGKQFIEQCKKVLKYEVAGVIGCEVPASEWLKLEVHYDSGFLTMEVPGYFRVLWTVIREEIPSASELGFE